MTADLTTFFFLFPSLSVWQTTNHIIRSFISFFFTLIFFSIFKDYSKNVRDFTFHSFFLPSFLSFISFFLFHVDFFLSLKITAKTSDITPSVLSFFLSFFYLSLFLDIMYTDTQMYTQIATLGFSIIRRYLDYSINKGKFFKENFSFRIFP